MWAIGLSADDEIGLFDGERCVGSVKLVDLSGQAPWIGIIAAADDPETPRIDGYTVGRPIGFRVWQRQLQRENTVAAASLSEAPQTFAPRGTALFELAGRIEPTHFALGPNIPNPFNPTTQIQYTLSQSASVSMVIYNLLVFRRRNTVT